MNPRRSLLRRGLDCDKAHRRPAHRFADCRGPRVRPLAGPRTGSGRVVLVAPHIGLGVSRRDQPHVMPQLGELTRPIMRRCTCLDPDQTARQLGKIRQYLPAPQPTGAPAASTACTWNTFLAKSSPTVVTCSMDGSRPLVLLKTNFGTIDAVSGPSTPSSPAMTALSRLDVRPIEKYTSNPS